METTSKLGMNRTGILTSPKDVREMLASSLHEAVPSPPGSESELAALRKSYISEADRVGSVPPPGTVRGILKAGAKMLTGKRPQALVDKIAERLAFERSGVRLYEGLIIKHQAKAAELGGVQGARLVEFHDEELAHFAMLAASLEELGADPTAQTPCADIVGVQGLGLIQTVFDPRTTFPQSLQAILVAELTDNDGWNVLIALAEQEGQTELADRFRGALVQEQEHLRQVRQWYSELTLAEGSIAGAARATH